MEQPASPRANCKHSEAPKLRSSPRPVLAAEPILMSRPPRAAASRCCQSTQSYRNLSPRSPRSPRSPKHVIIVKSELWGPSKWRKPSKRVDQPQPESNVLDAVAGRLKKPACPTTARSRSVFNQHGTSLHLAALAHCFYIDCMTNLRFPLSDPVHTSKKTNWNSKTVELLR